jgi:type I restriction enzyme M protein
VQLAAGIEDMKKTLWTIIDKLRVDMDVAEYKHFVLGLIFLKYISDSFTGRRTELVRKPTDENDNYCLGEDDPEALNAGLEDSNYREVNVFWMPEVYPRCCQAGGYWQAHQRGLGRHQGGKPQA